MKRVVCVLLCIPCGVQAGFTDSSKNRVYLEVDAGAGGLWAGSGNPFFPRLKSRGNFVTELAAGYDRVLFWKGFSVGAFVGVGYGNVGATTRFSSDTTKGTLSLRDRGFVEGGVRFAQHLTNRLVGSLKVGVSGHRMRGYLSGVSTVAGTSGTSGTSPAIGSIVVAAALSPNDGIGGAIGLVGFGQAIPNGQQIGIVAAGNIVNADALPRNDGIYTAIAPNALNGTQIGVVSGNTVVAQNSQTIVGTLGLNPHNAIPNGQQIGVVQGSASGGTTTSTLPPPATAKVGAQNRLFAVRAWVGLPYL